MLGTKSPHRRCVKFNECSSHPHSSAISPVWWALLGALLMAFGLWALVTDREAWNVVWYIPAWYGYLLILDSVICKIQGHSFISGRKRELGAMLFWSAPFWFFFEWYNFFIKNWYYIFGLHTFWIDCIFTFVAFATVFPACFFHAELFKALGLFSETRSTPLKIKGWRIQFCLVSGFLCLILPLVIPRYAYWMVWGAAWFIPSVFNYYSGAPSLLRDMEEGKPSRFLQLFVGGFMAGLVWEGLNYWARCKWIYTVPWVEYAKLFEMPMLGFVGFPFLSLECFACYTMICHVLRGGRHWETPDCLQLEKKPGRLFYLVAAIALLCSFVTYMGMHRRPDYTLRPLLYEMKGLEYDDVDALRGLGYPTPELLHKAVQTEGLETIANRAAIEQERLKTAFLHATLSIHKGMGSQFAALLMEVGIKNVQALLGLHPEELHNRLVILAKDENKHAPRLSQIKVWIRAANKEGEPIR